MNRKELLKKAFQRGHLLTIKSPLYKSWIEKFIVDETRGDIGEKGDITSNAVLTENPRVKAVVITREKGIAAGLEEASFLYRKNHISVTQRKKDGSQIKKGEILLELRGKQKDLLKIERSALDLIQRMSGIATLTNNIIKKTKNKVAIAPTRKTHWRYLDKKAVFVGKGLTHRLALWESILIKDNHIKALKQKGIKTPIELGLQRAWKKRKTANFIEIEVTNLEDAVRAASTYKQLNKDGKFPCLVMLDNMPPKRVKRTVKILKRLHLINSTIIEASGGITPKNITKYARTGIDVISMGYLTHSSHALDIKQYFL